MPRCVASVETMIPATCVPCVAESAAPMLLRKAWPSSAGWFIWTPVSSTPASEAPPVTLLAQKPVPAPSASPELFSSGSPGWSRSIRATRGSAASARAAAPVTRTPIVLTALVRISSRPPSRATTSASASCAGPAAAAARW